MERCMSDLSRIILKKQQKKTYLSEKGLCVLGHAILLHLKILDDHVIKPELTFWGEKNPQKYKTCISL